MATDTTPSSTLYGMLKELKISNKEAARVLLTDELSFGGKIPRERIEERTFLHRIVHSEPGDFPEMYFTDLVSDALTLSARATSKTSPLQSMDDLATFLSGDHASMMAESLSVYGQDGSLFLNIIAKIDGMTNLSDADRASMMLLAYLAAGCYGDSSRAAELVEGFQPTLTARGFRTELAGERSSTISETSKEAEISSPLKLGLVRVIDGALDLGSVYPLGEGPDGTVIGSMATEASSINNVGPLVSRRHLRVFRDQDGMWYAQGLGSTNGTTLIRGTDKAEIVVEMPRTERKVEGAPVSIQPGDALCLADSTVFLVMVVR